MSQSLCCVPGKAGLAPHPRICCKSRILPVSKSLAAQTWLEQVSTAGLSTEGFVQVSFTPLLERDVFVLLAGK